MQLGSYKGSDLVACHSKLGLQDLHLQKMALIEKEKKKQLVNCGWMKSFSSFCLIIHLFSNWTYLATYSYLVTEWDEACHPGNCCALVVPVVIPRHCNLLDDGVTVDVVDGFYQYLEVKLTKEQEY